MVAAPIDRRLVVDKLYLVTKSLSYITFLRKSVLINLDTMIDSMFFLMKHQINNLILNPLNFFSMTLVYTQGVPELNVKLKRSDSIDRNHYEKN